MTKMGRSRPAWAVSLAAVLVAVEGAVLLAAAVLAVVVSVRADDARLMAIAGFFLAVWGLAVLRLAHMLRRHRPAARTPVIVIQVVALLVALQQLPTAATGLSPVLLAALAAAVLILLLVPAASRAAFVLRPPVQTPAHRPAGQTRRARLHATAPRRPGRPGRPD